MREEWRDVKGYEGLYEVSNRGRLKHFGKLIKACDNGNGYKQAHLYRASKKDRRVFTVHRLVLSHFKRAPKKREVAMHLDNDRANNSIGNLCWGTGRDNMLHAYKTGRQTAPVGANSARSKLNKQQVKTLRRLYAAEKFTMMQLAKIFKIAYSTTNYIINRKTHYDY